MSPSRAPPRAKFDPRWETRTKDALWIVLGERDAGFARRARRRTRDLRVFKGSLLFSSTWRKNTRAWLSAQNEAPRSQLTALVRQAETRFFFFFKKPAYHGTNRETHNSLLATRRSIESALRETPSSVIPFGPKTAFSLWKRPLFEKEKKRSNRNFQKEVKPATLTTQFPNKRTHVFAQSILRCEKRNTAEERSGAPERSRSWVDSRDLKRATWFVENALDIWRKKRDVPREREKRSRRCVT